MALPPDPTNGIGDAWGFGKGLAQGVGDGIVSAAEGVFDLAKGGYTLATDEAAREQAWQTAKALARAGKDYAGRAYDDPSQAFTDAKDGANRVYSAFEKARDAAAARGELAEFWGQAAGRAAFEVGTLIVPVGAATKFGKLAEGAKAADQIVDGIRAADKLAEGGAALAKAEAAAAKAAKAADMGVEILPCGKAIAKADLAEAANAAFRTHGWDGSIVNNPIADKMAEAYARDPRYIRDGKALSPEAIDQKVKELLSSGTDLPDPLPVKAGEKLYKLTPTGASPYSPFWATEAEIAKLKGLSNAEIADRLGLPVQSLPKEGKPFVLQSITAEKDVEIFRSTIAPVSQGAYEARGGAEQLLVIERSLFSDASPPIDF
jgi:hypothetical protein